MSLHRILRVTSRGRIQTVSLCELGHYEAAPFTADELSRLNAGGHVIRPEEIIVDLNAYYQASEAERGDRALQAVS